MKEGKYKAKITGCYTGESSEKKTPFFALEFTIDDGESIDYTAYLTDNTVERQLKILLSLGFTGKSIADLSDTSKTVAQLFPEIKEAIYIEVKDEPYTTKEGKEKIRQVVQWVNVGSGGTRFEHEQAVTVFKGLSFDGDLLRLRSTVAKPTLSDKKPAEEIQPPLNTDDIPF